MYLAENRYDVWQKDHTGSLPPLPLAIERVGGKSDEPIFFLIKSA
jgi:hypothetical protein